ncbi:MAG: 23S rRNA pseudouridine1911/1915/1917 synthase [Halioglobus sp.]|jgi:23S rRNA pseudouridine1911/1915/1917 synthase
MSDTVELEASVPAEMHSDRLDQVAARLFPQYSRSRLQIWIKKGELCVDGKACRPRDKVIEGAILSVTAELEQEVNWKGEEIALDIIYEDDSIFVINKPAGLVVHPAAGHPDGTLVNALLAHAPELSQLPRAGIVHRLDMDTSGIMVVARTLTAHHHLVNQLQKRTVKREYVALCIGAMTGGGTIDAPMGRHPKQRKKMAVVGGGKAAITHYRVEGRYGHHTRIAVNLETGRTHQIRVHMTHKKYPLIGDAVYGGRPRIPKGASDVLIDALRGFKRQALHARALGLIHPETEEQVHFECSLPKDLLDLIAILEREDPAIAREIALY